MGFFKDFPGHRQLYCNTCHAANLFHRYLRIPEPFPVGDVERATVLQGNQETYLWGGRSSEDRQDIYHVPSCCKKEKEKKEIIR